MPELSWQKSTFSEGPGVNCVELAAQAANIHLRESDAPGVALTTSRECLRALLRYIRTGEPEQMS
ncbi:DUF397 domain-containing protein [Streptomyces varsoviensis]|uniref:DUF397 domain-containing protein n=1 Tax=Streptomyces varsoviensis TaxID=67373 RepID=UPI00099712CC|nr:DUF397 domain-containing protein [Streptomyces varsoviensis]